MRDFNSARALRLERRRVPWPRRLAARFAAPPMILIMTAGFLSNRASAQHPASAPGVAPPLSAAIDGQRRVLAELSRILQEEKATLSDGTVRTELEALLRVESKQIEAIRALGPRTLGKRDDELSDPDKAERNRLADEQTACEDRYRRLEKNIQAKVRERADSPFTKVLQAAENGRLAERMGEAAGAIRANQLGRGHQIAGEVVTLLQQLLETLGGKPPSNADHSPAAGNPGFVPPAPGSQLTNLPAGALPLSGKQANALGTILRAVQKLGELAERQTAVAAQVKARAGRDRIAEDLAREEQKIRAEVLEVADGLAILDPQLERMVRSAAVRIEQAIPSIEKGPLTGAVDPSRQAAEELQTAASRLSDLWKNLLALMKQYAQQDAPAANSTASALRAGPGAVDETSEKLVFQMLRAIAALTEAIERQTALLEQTRSTGPDGDWQGLASRQSDLAGYLTSAVLAENVPAGALPPRLRERVLINYAAADLLRESQDRMRRARDALNGKQKPEAALREREALDLLGDALQAMVHILQVLMGQFSEQGAPSTPVGAAGVALDPSGEARRLAGHTFQLQPQELETVRRAFGDTFPQRYDHAIKAYYQVIAHEDSPAAGRGKR